MLQFSIFIGHQDLWTDPSELTNVKSGFLLGSETDFTTRFIQVTGNIASSKVYCSKCLQVVHGFDLAPSLCSAFPSSLTSLPPALPLVGWGSPFIREPGMYGGIYPNFKATAGDIKVRRCRNISIGSRILWQQEAIPSTHGHPLSTMSTSAHLQGWRGNPRVPRVTASSKAMTSAVSTFMSDLVTRGPDGQPQSRQ